MVIVGNEFTVPPALDRYLAIKREFRKMSNKSAKKFLSQTSIDDFGEVWQMAEGASLPEGICTWGKAYGRLALNGVVEKGISTLTERGCYSVDEKQYVEKYLDFSEIKDCAESGMVMEALIELENDERVRESERRKRTAHWGHGWVGGTLGGGIKGALKGALKAEIMNVGGTLASDVVNRVGRRRSRGKMIGESERLFDLFRIEMAEAIRAAIRANVDGYVRCLNECLGDDVSCEWADGNRDAASGILGNLIAGRVPEKCRKEAIGELVRLNPFSADAYDWIYRNETGLRKEVEALADYFCVEVESIEELRREKAKAARIRAKEQAERKRMARQAVREADEARRTVFGTVWPSIDEMENARADKQCFFKRVEAIAAQYSAQDGFAGNRLTGKKLAKIQAVFETLYGERVIWLLDTSTWYNANYGLLITDKGLRWKNRDANLSKVSCLCWQAFGVSEKPPRMLKDGVLCLAKGAKVDMDVNVNWKEKWLPVIVSFWKYWREGTFEKSAEEMSDPEEKLLPSAIDGTGKAKSMTLVEVILKTVADVGGGLYCKPNIPEKKLVNAKMAMSVLPGETVVALMDTTFFGSAKTGVVLTTWGVRWANDWATDSKRTGMSWPELRGCRPYSVNDCKLTLSADAVIGTAGGGMSAANLAKAIGLVVDFLAEVKNDSSWHS